jgi:acetylornithine deacetylase
MKGFIALASNLAVAAAARRATPLCLLFTCDEELGSLGAQSLVRCAGSLGPLPRAAIIGEPTSLRAVRMHKGHLKLRVTLHGRAAHSGSPHLGVNAIEPAGEVIAALSSLRRALAEERVASAAYFADVPFAVLTIARIQGGEAMNVIPEHCAIDIGVRLLPGQDSHSFIERIRRTVDEAVPGCRHSLEVINDNPPMEVADDAAVHRRLCGLIGQSTSHGVSFASDAGHLQRVGLQCVLFGPGSMDVAHRPNEFVPRAEMARCRQVLERMLESDS